MQIDRAGLPASAPANAVVQYHVARSPGTTCGTSWTGPLNVPIAGVTSFPSARTDALDPTLVQVTLPSYVYTLPIQFRTDCRGEDGSVAADSVGIRSTMPLLSAIDSIVPRTIPTDTAEKFRIFAHGCPFTSPVGFIHGAPDALDGTLYFPGGSSPTAQAKRPDSDFIRTTLETCNITTFFLGMKGMASGELFYVFLRNPGQPTIAIALTIR
jgi:hypothetical protein